MPIGWSVTERRDRASLGLEGEYRAIAKNEGKVFERPLTASTAKSKSSRVKLSLFLRSRAFARRLEGYATRMVRDARQMGALLTVRTVGSGHDPHSRMRDLPTSIDPDQTFHMRAWDIGGTDHR